ncbi:MAG: energy transducer TonB [Leptothrix sp. (in: b-proteobacteria)]
MAGTGGLTPADSSRAVLRRRQLLGCLAVVGLIHLALLGDWQRPTVAARTSASASSGSAAPLATRARTVVVRLRQEPDRDNTRVASDPPTPAASPPSASAEPAQPAGRTEVAAPAPAHEPLMPGGEQIDPSLYLPRSALTEGASPLDMVDLPYPDQAPSGDFRAELTLFIDQDGSVRRVRIEEGALPAALADAARQAFLRARFAPGSIDGVAVRTRMRIEIEFSAAPRPDAPHGAP